MTGALLDKPRLLFADAAERPAGGGSPMARGRVTLEELLSATLHAARTNGSADCPVCHARMTSTHAREGARAVEAVCAGCGSRLV